MDMIFANKRGKIKCNSNEHKHSSSNIWRNNIQLSSKHTNCNGRPNLSDSLCSILISATTYLELPCEMRNCTTEIHCFSAVRINEKFKKRRKSEIRVWFLTEFSSPNIFVRLGLKY